MEEAFFVYFSDIFFLSLIFSFFTMLKLRLAQKEEYTIQDAHARRWMLACSIIKIYTYIHFFMQKRIFYVKRLGIFTTQPLLLLLAAASMPSPPYVKFVLCQSYMTCVCCYNDSGFKTSRNYYTKLSRQVW